MPMSLMRISLLAHSTLERVDMLIPLIWAMQLSSSVSVRIDGNDLTSRLFFLNLNLLYRKPHGTHLVLKSTIGQQDFCPTLTRYSQAMM